MRLSLQLLAFVTLAGLGNAAGPVTNSLGMRLVPIPAGSFVMGQNGPASDYKVAKHPERFNDADWDEKPAHRVTITQTFHMAATEVTLAQYRAMDADFRAGDKEEDVALGGISWEQAVKFCDWLSNKEGRTYRLPTEAEWEYACRAGTTTLFYTGDTLPDGFQSWTDSAGFRERFFQDKPMPKEYSAGTKRDLRVAQGAPNAWGLHDMHGNLSEWCLDWYGPYEAGDQNDPLGRVEGDFRVIRGGHHSTFVRLLRSANRAAWLPQTKSDKVGFRVVLADFPPGKPLPFPALPLHAQGVSQSTPKIELPPQDVPFFDGPKPFVIIPPDSFGPLFSWHNHSPAITECPNGDLLAVWYSCVDEGGTELNNLASRLRLGKSAWEPASVFWDGADINDHAPKLWWDGDKTIYHFARGRDEDIVRRSADNGVTWTKAQTFQPVSEIGNQLLRSRDGTIYMTQDSANHSLTISRDDGKTWTSAIIADKKEAFRSGSPARHAGIHAPIVELKDGRLMTFGRLNTEAEQAKFNFKTPASFSSDGGKTWTHEATEFPAISSVQRQVLIRLAEGALLFCSFTDLSANARNPRGMTFKSKSGEFNGAGLFAAVSFDDGRTWPHKRLITPGGPERTVNGIDRSQFKLSDTRAEPQGYLAAIQSRDGRIQLISSRNHYVFNLAWLKTLPEGPQSDSQRTLCILVKEGEFRTDDGADCVDNTAMRSFIFSLIVSVSALPLPAQEPVPKTPETFDIGGNKAFLCAAPKPAAGKPWLWYAPTLRSLSFAERKLYFESFMKAGISIAGFDLGEVRGSPASTAKFTLFYDEMVKRGFSAKPILLGQSRGGMMTLAWAFRHPDKVKAWVGIYPVCNLASWPLKNSKAQTLADYALAEPELIARLPEFNPIDNLKGLLANKVPMFAVHGDSDVVVPYNDNTRLLKERYEAGGGQVSVKVIPGEGHKVGPSFFECRELIEFVLRQVGN